jgi:hypothetical protein
MLTEERIKQMRADAISDPRNAQEFWYMLMARAVEAEATAPLLARIAELEKELETERMRLAACGVVAMANTRESAETARQMCSDYMSGSCKDVMRAVDAEMGYRERIAELEKANEAFAARQEWWNSRMFELEQKVAELEADAKRLEFVEVRLFGKSWNGVIDSGSRTDWRIASDYRHTTQKMVGHTFRDALDNAMKEQP